MTTETKSAPKAFAGNDSSVYLAQAMAVADLLGTGNPADCAKESVNEAGFLIFMLLDAARELDAAERMRLRAAAATRSEAQP